MARKVQRNERHKQYVKLLNAKRWYGELRPGYLQEHPLCEVCLKNGRVAAARDVHHLRPVEGATDAVGDTMQDRCYDPTNLIAVCRECHIELHRQMRSHQGQLASSMPKEQTQETQDTSDWVQQVSGGKANARMKVRKGVHKTRFGWLTTEEYQQKQRDEADEWLRRVRGNP